MVSIMISNLQYLSVLLWHLLKLGLLFLLLRFVIVYTHRWFFNQLAHIPGPFIAKFSDWYGAYHSARGQLHIRTLDGHRHYGHAVRQGPNKVVFNTITALNNIYHNRSVQKSKGYLSMIPGPGIFNIHTAVDKDIHRFKRRVISQGLSDQCMREFEPTLITHVNKFIRNLAKFTIQSPEDWSEPINMTDQCKYLGYDVMGEFGFGQSFELLEKPDNRFLIDAVTATSHRSGVYGQFPDLAKAKLDTILYPRASAMRMQYMDLTTRLVQARIKAESDGQSKNDLFSFIVNAKDSETGKGFSQRELWSETRFLLVAGSDTSSTALSSLFFYLTRYPASYKEAAEEVRGTFTSGKDIHSGANAKMRSCGYLRACIDEAMRMSPPAGGTLWREVSPKSGGIVVDGIYIPEGYDVGCSIYCVQHNEEYFADAFTFNPNRWIVSENNPREKVELARQAFVPFSLGPRGCAGRTMAYMELSNTMAKVLWYFDFKAAEGELGNIGAGNSNSPRGRQRAKEFQLEDHLTSSHNGPYIQFKLREGVSEGLW